MPITVCFNDWTARTPERKVISTTRDCDRPLPYPLASWAHHSTFSRSSAEIPSTAQTPSSTKSTLKRAATHVKSSSQTHAAGDHSRSASDQYSVPAAPNFTMQPVHMSAVRRCGGVVEEERLSPSQYRYLAHVGVSQHRAGMQVHHAAVSFYPCCCEDGYNCASDRGCCRSSWNLLLLRNPRPFLGEALMSRCCGRHAMMGAIGCAGWVRRGGVVHLSSGSWTWLRGVLLTSPMSDSVLDDMDIPQREDGNEAGSPAWAERNVPVPIHDHAAPGKAAQDRMPRERSKWLHDDPVSSSRNKRELQSHPAYPSTQLGLLLTRVPRLLIGIQ